MSLRLAVLAMLDLEPASGYALLRRFQNSAGFFWHTSHQQLYKELHALHAEGLIDCAEVEQDGKPDMKVYTLNECGGRELDALLAQAATPLKIRDPLLVKLFAGRRLPPSELRAELESHRDQHRRTLATYEELVAYFAAIPVERSQRYFFPQQTLRMGVLYEQAWLQWCEEVLAGLPDTDR
jgi:PadR family transcriptional regulator AphA